VKKEDELSNHLTDTELDALTALEDEQARGEPVRWDQPKTVKGVVARDLETFSYRDANDGGEKTKRVLTLRTEKGLAAIFDGPAKLTSRLFNGERQDGEPTGPPGKGCPVIVEYRGEKVSQTTGRAYKDFAVYRGEQAHTNPDDIPF
jgi:hypothetical protein